MLQFTDQQLATLPRVTNKEIYQKTGTKIFHQDGLFSEQIFGPCKDYTCQCNYYFQDPSMKGTRCHNCGVVVESTAMRSKSLAVIELPFRVLLPNIVMLKASRIKTILDSIDKSINKDARNIKDVSLFIISKILKSKTRNKNANSKSKSTVPSSATNNSSKIISIEQYESDSDICSDGNESKLCELKFTLNDLDDESIEEYNKYTTRYIVVIPPSLRPIWTQSGSIDEINSYYRSILAHIEEMQDDTSTETYRPMMESTIWHKYVELVLYLKAKISGKSGFFRKRILGRRIEYSARTAITPDPYLVNKVRLPFSMVAAIFEPHIVKRAIDNGILNPMKQLMDIKYGNYDVPNFNTIKNIMMELAESTLVVLNRQPSLHISNMQAYQWAPSENGTIQIPINITSPFNADFDGDTVIGDVTLLDANGAVLFSGSMEELWKEHTSICKH